MLADPGGPGGRLGPLGWRLEDASNPAPFSGLTKKIFDLGLEHVD